MSKEQTNPNTLITAEEFLEKKGHSYDSIIEEVSAILYEQSYVSDLMEQYANAKVLEALEKEEKEFPKMYWDAKQVTEDNNQRYHPSDRINAYGYIKGFNDAIEFLKTTTKQK